MSKVQGKIPGYETVFITRVDMTDDALKTLKDKLTNVISQYGGELVYQEDWGKRKFAYPIKKETRGQYTYFVYTGKGDVVAEFERNLRLNDFNLRFLSVNLSKEFDKEVFTKELGAGTAMKRDDRAGQPEGMVVAS
jgi:small subunit ribosomal protein S6